MVIKVQLLTILQPSQSKYIGFRGFRGLGFVSILSVARACESVATPRMCNSASRYGSLDIHANQFFVDQAPACPNLHQHFKVRLRLRVFLGVPGKSKPVRLACQ